MTAPPELRGWRRAALVLAPLLVTVLFATVLLRSFDVRRDSTARVQATYARIGLLHELRARLTEAETGQRGFLIAGDSAYLAPFRNATADVERLLVQLERDFAGEGGQAAAVAELRAQVRERVEILHRPLAASALGFAAAREELIEGRGLETMRRLRADMRRLEQAERAQLQVELEAQERAGRAVLLALLGGVLILIVVATLTNRFFVRHAAALERLNAELQEQSLEVELQSQELQAQAAHLEETTEELMAANEQLEQRTYEAEAANQAKLHFLRSMSHELRTPLNAIQGYTDLLELQVHGGLNDAQRNSVARIRHNSRHLLVLINDILNFARIEAGRIELHLEHVTVGSLLHDVASMIRPVLQLRELALEVPTTLDGMAVRADSDRLRQILLNLLSNAAKHGATGGTIRLHVHTAGADVVHIEVQDDGPGIPPELHERIFDPFVQVLPQSSAGGEGVGLGLSISRELARAMHGEISVESVPGAGSSFRITLPRSIEVTV